MDPPCTVLRQDRLDLGSRLLPTGMLAGPRLPVQLNEQARLIHRGGVVLRGGPSRSVSGLGQRNLGSGAQRDETKRTNKK